MGAAAATRYTTAFGHFELRRYPRRRLEPLQAWCAADTLLLDEIRQRAIPGAAILVANDEHGALSVALGPRAVWTDSMLATTAIALNLRRNRRPPVAVVWSTQAPPRGLELVALRVPKQQAFFEYQLAALSAALSPGAVLLASGMDKHLSPRTAGLLESFIGPTTRHPGQHKARLFSAVRDTRPATPLPPPTGYFCEQLDARLEGLANVFSRDQLDIGSRLLLDNLHRLQPAPRGLDLACGNGVLGLAALRQDLCRQMVFCDESAMALASARANAAQLFPDAGQRTAWHHGDGLRGLTDPLDLILCNPPFHLGHTVDEFAGHRLLRQCGAHLAPGGSLCVVANRHLNYRATLQRHFPAVETLARNNKFVLWLATGK